MQNLKTLQLSIGWSALAFLDEILEAVNLPQLHTLQFHAAVLAFDDLRGFLTRRHRSLRSFELVQIIFTTNALADRFPSLFAGRPFNL